MQYTKNLKCVALYSLRSSPYTRGSHKKVAATATNVTPAIIKRLFGPKRTAGTAAFSCTVI